MLQFFLTLDTIDVLRLVHSHFCAIKLIFKVHKRSVIDLGYYFIHAEVSINQAQNINRIQSQEKTTLSNEKCASATTLLIFMQQTVEIIP